jgi:putative addiction module component (TIGR02574 family)
VLTDLLCGKPLSARLASMNARVDHVLDEVLALTADERSAVAAALLDSLEDADTASISDAWREEVKRRRNELRSGVVRALPWSEVKQRLSTL